MARHQSRELQIIARASKYWCTTLLFPTMVLCVVVGCSNRSGRNKDISFYKMPKITTSKGSRILELSKKRRARYIAAISRGDLTEKILANDRICSRHFISGKPASLENETNPDWLPSLNLGHSKVRGNQVQVGERWNRRKVREEARNVVQSKATVNSGEEKGEENAGEEWHDHVSASSTELNNSCDLVDNSVEVPCDSSTQTICTSSSSVGVQTDMSSDLVSFP